MEAWQIVKAPPRRESIPDRWTQQRIQERLLDAFEVDAREPKTGARGYGNGSLRVGHTAAERIVRGKFAEAEFSRGEIEPLQPAPSGNDRSTAARVMAWLAMVADALLRLALIAWLKIELIGDSHKAYCRREGILLATFLHRKEAALEIIASKLNSNRVPVF